MFAAKITTFTATVLFAAFSGYFQHVEAQQIETRAQKVKAVAPPLSTGQTVSFAIGDDADLKPGVAWPSPRLKDNGDGTVTDHLTGLIWLKTANGADGPKNWEDALRICNSLADGQQGLADKSEAGDWRLPTRFELESILDLSQERGNNSLPADHPFTGTPKATGKDSRTRCWSSTTHSSYTMNAWFVNLRDGSTDDANKSARFNVWPVKGPVTGGKVAVPATGQTKSYAKGDDGDLKPGMAWPSPRFTDNEDGTVTDNLTGLIWLKDVGALDKDLTTWAKAIRLCNFLRDGQKGLTDWSEPGDWRMPTRFELESLLDLSQSKGLALPSGHPFINVPKSYVWTSTAYIQITTYKYGDEAYYAWFISLDDGYTGIGNKPNLLYVWPVRGPVQSGGVK